MVCCNDLKNMRENHPELFKLDDSYGQLISWIVLTEEEGYTRIHNYAIPISYCPFCGKILGEDND